MKASLPIAVFLFLVGHTSGLSQWSSDPLVANTRVVTNAGSQLRPFMVPDYSGGTIIVWEDYRQGTDPDIYYERINSSGVASWTSFESFTGRKLCATTLPRTINKVLADGAGGFYIVWDQKDAADFNVYVQKVNSTGQQMWGTDGIAVCNAANDQYGADFMQDANNNIFVTWRDQRNDPLNSRAPQTYAQLLNINGSSQWTANGIQISNTISYPIGLVSDDNDGVIIAYLDARNSLLDANNLQTNWDIYAQRINDAGAAQWTANGMPVCTQNKNQTVENNKPGMAVVPDNLGGIIITWSDYRNDARNGLSFPYRADLYAQRLSSTGSAAWALNGIAICSGTGGDLYATTTIPDNEGGIITAWYDLRSNPLSAIYMQRISSTGTRSYAVNGIPIVNNQNHIINYEIVDDGLGNILAAYDTDANDIYLSRFLRSNGTSTSSARAVCTRTEPSVGPALTSDQSGNVFISWEDYRNNAVQADLYAFNFQSTTLLPITLLSFTGQWLTAETAQLQWQVTNQAGVKKYTLLRSTNGIDFTPVGNIAATNGSNTATLRYAYSDITVFAGQAQYYYKLQWQEPDGDLRYSTTILLQNKQPQAPLWVSPNPTASMARLHVFCPTAETISIKLIDAKGTPLMQQTKQLPAGTQQVPLSVGHLPVGWYKIQVIRNNKVTTLNLLKM